jgi:predicted kinase
MTENTRITGTAQSRKPSLIVVTGQPGAGKTSLVHSLARAIRCPALCRDELKEGLVNTTGIGGAPADDLAGDVYEAFFDTINLLLSYNITLVIEAAFQHKLWAPKLEPLREIARVRIVVCTVDPELARVRQIEREQSDPTRAWFHHNRLAQAARDGSDPPRMCYDPPHLDVPTLTVNTSEGYVPDFETVVSFARA